VVDPSTAFLSSLRNSEKQLLQRVIIDEFDSRNQGSREPTAVMEGVKERLRSRERENWTVEMLRRFDQYPEEALALVAHNVERQSLPRDERQRLRKASGAFYKRQSMETKSPTEAQIRYLRDLGYEGSIDSRLHASDLIDQIRKAGNN
jgi:hypothetical protein